MTAFRISLKDSKEMAVREADQLHVTSNGALCGLVGSRIVWVYQADMWLFAEDAIEKKLTR